MLLFPVVPKVIANSKLVYPKQKDKRRKDAKQKGKMGKSSMTAGGIEPPTSYLES
jgi:hypothetical protein